MLFSIPFFPVLIPWTLLHLCLWPLDLCSAAWNKARWNCMPGPSCVFTAELLCVCVSVCVCWCSPGSQPLAQDALREGCVQHQHTLQQRPEPLSSAELISEPQSCVGQSHCQQSWKGKEEVCPRSCRPVQSQEATVLSLQLQGDTGKPQRPAVKWQKTTQNSNEPLSKYPDGNWRVLCSFSLCNDYLTGLVKIPDKYLGQVVLGRTLYLASYPWLVNGLIFKSSAQSLGLNPSVQEFL